MLCLILLGSALGVLAQEPDLPATLEALVDLPTAEDRARRADELARRAEISLEDWRAAMLHFGRFEDVGPGPQSHRVELDLAGDPVTVDIHLYVPGGYDPATPAPLLFLFHGSGGDGRSMLPMWRDVAERLGALLLAPTDSGENVGYTFDGRELRASMAALRWMRRRFNVDENRIHLSGISRGGHLTWDLGARRPDRWASLSPMIGGPAVALTDGRNNMRLLENLAHLPIRDLQGEEDDPGLLDNLHMAFERLEEWEAPDAQLLEFPGRGHGFDFRSVDWPEFLGSARRDPTPEEVVLTACRPHHARSHWVEILKLGREVEDEFRPVFSNAQAAKWNRLDDLGKKRMVQELADERTARVEARFLEPGKFRIETDQTERFRLLLPEEMLHPEGRKLRITVNGRRRSRSAEPSKEVLLREFADRFDRSFLPVVSIPLRD